MADSTTPVIEILQGGFARMPAAIFAGLFLALAFIGIKASLGAWRSTRILVLVARTPAIDVGFDGAAKAASITVRSAAGRRVKIHGEAEPAEHTNTDHELWRVIEVNNGRGSRTRATKAVPIVIETPVGPCRVDTRRAVVVPSRSHTDQAMFDRDRFSVDKAILRGDEVFAIGKFQAFSSPDQTSGASTYAPPITCELRPIWGLLLLSGQSERNVSVLYGLWLAVQLPLATLCLLLAFWGANIHLSTYPHSPPGVRASFFEALRSFPLENDPGAEVEVRRERRSQPKEP